MTSWKLESGALVLPTVDMHAAGEPVRIFDARHLDLRGGTLLEMREDLSRRHDGIRRTLMLEPRGHADMYGAILLPPSSPDAHAGAVFTHVSGYSTMCGHATIALGRYLYDRLGSACCPRMVIECPCGPVVAEYEPAGEGPGLTTFRNVPSFASGLDLETDLPDGRRVRFDIAFGGAYYAILPAASLGVDLRRDPVVRIAEAAGALVAGIRARDVVRHPSEPALGFLYGAILTSGPELSHDSVNEHLCWFGEGQIDRSPTGSGVSARLALAAARGEPVQDRSYVFAGLSGDTFSGRVVNGDPDHVLTTVSGRAFYTGAGAAVSEPSDPFGAGFDPLAHRGSPEY